MRATVSAALPLYNPHFSFSFSMVHFETAGEFGTSTVAKEGSPGNVNHLESKKQQDEAHDGEVVGLTFGYPMMCQYL
eukprot:478619-Amphidinium_carterae.1